MNLIFILLAFCGIFEVCLAGNDCKHKYRVVNLYGDLTEVNISCYIEHDFCNIRYSESGFGCDGNSVSIATLNAGETRSVAHTFKMGGAICADYQVDVTHMHMETVSQWPKATDAGKKFAKIVWNGQDELQNYRMVLATLGTAANITYSAFDSDNKIKLLLKPYSTHFFEEQLNANKETKVTVSSDVPIIAIYHNLNDASSSYHVWQPLSENPVFIHVPEGFFLSHGLFDCTGTDILATDNAIVETGAVGGESKCLPKYENVTLGKVVSYDQDCAILLTPPQVGVCVSATLYGSPENAYMAKDMAMPNSKLPRTYVSTNLDTFAGVFSDLDADCSVVLKNDLTLLLKFNTLGPNLNRTYYYGESPANLKDIKRIDCPDLVYFMLNGTYQQSVSNSGLNLPELWSDYFVWLGCPLPPPLPFTFAPTPAPAELSEDATMAAPTDSPVMVSTSAPEISPTPHRF